MKMKADKYRKYLLIQTNLEPPLSRSRGRSYSQNNNAGMVSWAFHSSGTCAIVALLHCPGSVLLLPHAPANAAFVMSVNWEEMGHCLLLCLWKRGKHEKESKEVKHCYLVCGHLLIISPRGISLSEFGAHGPAGGLCPGHQALLHQGALAGIFSDWKLWGRSFSLEIKQHHQAVPLWADIAENNYSRLLCTTVIQWEEEKGLEASLLTSHSFVRHWRRSY